MISKKNREKIACVFLLVTGIGCCIAGFFVPGLMVVGGALLAGGLGIAANIFNDKDRIVVNNNYTAGTPPADLPVQPPKDFVEDPGYGLKPDQKNGRSFFAFKNKKYMEKHEHKDEDEDDGEHESNSMQIPPHILEQINRLSDTLEGMDLKEINKILHKKAEKVPSTENPNSIS